MSPQPTRERSLKERNRQRKKRRESLEWKVYEMGQVCDFDVALFMYNREAQEHYVYISTDHESWPPTLEKIRANPTTQIKFPKDIERIGLKKVLVRRRSRRVRRATIPEEATKGVTLSEAPSRKEVTRSKSFLSEPPSFTTTKRKAGQA